MGSVLVKAQTKDTITIIKKAPGVPKQPKEPKAAVSAKGCDDTLFRKMKVNVRMDSVKLRMRKMDVHIRYDSLSKIRLRQSLRFDSLRVNMKLKMRDSGYKKMIAYQRMDSIKFKTHLQNFKMDSVKLKMHLKELKMQLKSLKSDSMRAKMRSREITMELPFVKDATMYIENIGRRAVIRTTNNNKVKVQTTVYYDGDVNITDAEWFAKLNLELRSKDGGVQLQSIDEKDNGRLFQKKTTSLFSASDDLNIKENKKKAIIIYIPVNATLDIESKYGNVAIENNIKYLKADISNASLVMLNADKAVIKSRSTAIKAGNIKDADLDLTNCTLVSKDINKLKIDSRNSKVSFENTNQMVLKSTSDQYQITEVYGMEGNKNFGKMNIARLKNNITLTGSSADLNITSIDRKADLIKIDNKYADVRLPVYNLKAYTVNFDGKNSKVFTAFQKNKMAGDSLKGLRSSFTATVGDVGGSHTKFQINCNSCNVDFNN